MLWSLFLQRKFLHKGTIATSFTHTFYPNIILLELLQQQKGQSFIFCARRNFDILIFEWLSVESASSLQIRVLFGQLGSIIFSRDFQLALITLMKCESLLNNLLPQRLTNVMVFNKFIATIFTCRFFPHEKAGVYLARCVVYSCNGDYGPLYTDKNVLLFDNFAITI